MRVLVTGGAGFIGSFVVDALVDGGHEVRVLDVLHPMAHRARPDYLRPEVDYRWHDVTDPDAVAAAVSGVDAVSHQAAMVGLGVDLGDIGRYVRDNDLGTAVLLEALHHAGFAGRLVVASSMVVYGEGRYRCADHGVVRPGPRRPADLDAGRWEPPCPVCGAPLASEPVPEDAPVDPRNVYAATKLHQEHLAACFAREHPAAAVVALRYHNVYGPRMPFATPYAGVASIFRSALERGEAPRVFEDGGQRRDFVHVRDVARANVLALTGGGPAAGFATYNVASGDPRTVGDMAEALADAFEKRAEALADAFGEHAAAPRPVVVGGYRLGDVRHVVGSPARAAAELGYRAEVPFAAGVAEFATAPLRG